MPALELVALSLRYSSWSMRPWLALRHAGIEFTTRVVALADLAAMQQTGAVIHAAVAPGGLGQRRALGSVTGLFPVLWIDGQPVHEALAICEWAAEHAPRAMLWPTASIARAQARSLASEMATGFPHLRRTMSCHLFARVPGFHPEEGARVEIARIFELWSGCLERSGGPFLFGAFGVVDCMYFPVITRFATYGVTLPPALARYADAVYELPAVRDLVALARTSPAVEAYDAYVRSLGGDPVAAL
ncbi:MAG: glutathione S-transferase [Nannocystaceae bacterium]